MVTSQTNKGCFVACAFFGFWLLLTANASNNFDGDFRSKPQTPSKGRKFVFAFMDNCLQEHEDVTRGPKLTIIVPPDSDPTVVVNITLPYVEFSETVSIPAGDLSIVQLPYPAIAHGTGRHNNGIVVEASDDVFVYGISEEERHSRSEGFLALPVSSLGRKYVVASLEQKRHNSRRHAEFVVVSVADKTTIIIEDSKGAFTYEGQVFPSGSSLTLNLTQYEVVQILSLDDMSGTKVFANRPVALLSGMDCGTMKIRHSVRSGCGHMIEQLPPVEAWGQHFIYRPSVGGPNTRHGRRRTEPVEDVKTKLKIFTFHEDTSFLIDTSNGRVIIEREFEVGGTETIHITAFKPIMVVAFMLYHGACKKGCKKRSPTMTYIPPLTSAAPQIAFTTINATDRNENSAMNHYLSLLYDCTCPDFFVWEGIRPENVFQEGFPVMDDQMCWTQYEVTEGTYSLSSRSTGGAINCFFSAFLSGHGSNGGYVLPLGLNAQVSDSPTSRRKPSTAAGTDFSFSFAAYHVDPQRGPKLSIHRANSDKDTAPISGVVTCKEYSQKFVIPVGEASIEVQLPSSVILRDTRAENGSPVEVRTNDNVVIYGLNDAFTDRSDAFLALPTAMMGMKYFLVGSVPSLHYSTEDFMLFVISGLHNDTFVSLNLRGALWFRNQVHYGGSSVGFTINRNQALFFMSRVDQTGTEVLASKPISVMSGATCGYSYFSYESQGRCNYMITHLPPVDRWGKQFVASAFDGYGGGDTTTFIMSLGSTVVTINDGEPYHLHRGQPLSVYLSETNGLHAFIEANKPVLVYQVSGYSPLNYTSGYSVPSLTLVPSLDETDNENISPDVNLPLARFKVRDSPDTVIFATVAMRCSAIANATMNGVAFQQSDWSDPISASDFCVIRKRLSGESYYRFNTGGTKASVVLYGWSSVSGYSCPSTL